MTVFAREPPRHPNGTPINLLGITDWEELFCVEYETSLARAINLLKGRVALEQTFDAEHLRAIHHYLFQDVYAWAGQFRSCSISKELYVDGERFVSYFCEPKFFDEEFAVLQEKTNQFACATGLDNWSKTAALVDVFVLANHIHPFPEGNGRALRIFIEQLANTQELHFDFACVAPDEWNLACAVSGIYGSLSSGEFQRLVPDHRPLFEIFGQILVPLDGTEYRYDSQQSPSSSLGV